MTRRTFSALVYYALLVLLYLAVGAVAVLVCMGLYAMGRGM
jgi:hypothetical protein